MDVADAESPLLRDFYRDLLRSSFPVAQLVGEQDFVAGHGAGGARTILALDEQHRIRGGISGEWYPSSGVFLLGYLAVDPLSRGAGIGASLLRRALDRWCAEFAPLLVLGEVEDPRRHAADEFGDPWKRLRFYRRLAARALPLPYFQPALGASGSRVFGFLLMVFAADPSACTGGSTTDTDGTVDGAVVERFLREYLLDCEGRIGAGDADVDRLLAACRSPGGIPLLPPGVLPG